MRQGATREGPELLHKGRGMLAGGDGHHRQVLQRSQSRQTEKSSWAGSTGRCAWQERLTEGSGRGGQIACSKDVGGEDVE